MTFLEATGLLLTLGVLGAGGLYHGIRPARLALTLQAHGLMPYRVTRAVSFAVPCFMLAPLVVAMSGMISGDTRRLAVATLASSVGLLGLAGYAAALASRGSDAPCGCLSSHERLTYWTPVRAALLACPGIPGSVNLLQGRLATGAVDWSIVGPPAALVAITAVAMVWHGNLLLLESGTRDA